MAQCYKQRCGDLVHIVPKEQRNETAWRKLEVETKVTRDSNLREALETNEIERNTFSIHQLREELKKLSKSEHCASFDPRKYKL